MKVKYSNLKIWFKEKVSQPRWYVDLFSYRRFWGALSIYSHCRCSDGKPNIAYSTPNKAQKAVRSMLPTDVFMQRKKILENILLKYSEE
jgi:hypothetical protein